VSLGDRRRAGEDQHFVGDLRRRNPDLRAVDDVDIGAAFGPGLDLRGLEAGIGLRHREVGLLLASGDRRQHPTFLLFAGVNRHRVEPENVHVNGRRAGKAGARLRDRLHHQGSLGDAEARADIGLRNADCEPAVIGKCEIEFFRKFSVAIALEPILALKACADFFDRATHRLLKFAQGKVDCVCSFKGSAIRLFAEIAAPYSLRCL